MSEPPILRATELRKRYRAGGRFLDVLQGVSLEVRRGEFLAIEGPSGAGKTTLLHLLTGIDDATSGEVSFLEQPFGCFGAGKKAKFRNSHMGLVFQFYHLFSDLTALENVMLPARVHGNRKKLPIRQKALSLLGDLGLADRVLHFPSQLSGGEMQRVAMARALINDPEILFCDEPTGNLDSATGQAVCGYLRQWCDRDKKTVLIVTHDDRIAGLADRLLKLRDGMWDPADEGTHASWRLKSI